MGMKYCITLRDMDIDIILMRVSLLGILGYRYYHDEGITLRDIGI
jgi:hypothetical protein